jgi:hypothetical protein
MGTPFRRPVRSCWGRGRVSVRVCEERVARGCAVVWGWARRVKGVGLGHCSKGRRDGCEAGGGVAEFEVEVIVEGLEGAGFGFGLPKSVAREVGGRRKNFGSQISVFARADFVALDATGCVDVLVSLMLVESANDAVVPADSPALPIRSAGRICRASFVGSISVAQRRYGVDWICRNGARDVGGWDGEVYAGKEPWVKCAFGLGREVVSAFASLAKRGFVEGIIAA